jgi:hypothetical protein
MPQVCRALKLIECYSFFFESKQLKQKKRNTATKLIVRYLKDDVTHVPKKVLLAGTNLCCKIQDFICTVNIL